MDKEIADQIERLQNDVIVFKSQWQKELKEKAQFRAESNHWKAEVERTAQKAKLVFDQLESIYKRSFNEAIMAISGHKNGQCKGCDLNVLAQKVASLQPLTLAVAQPQRAK